MIRWSVEHGMTVRRIGEGPELVWIHGLGEASTCFDEIITYLPGRTHVLPDLPGYGRSPWPAEPQGLDALADHVAAWLGERPPAIVLGHSMGGVLAVLIAERAPVRAIVDIEGNISAGDCTYSGRAAAYSHDEFIARGFAVQRELIYELSLREKPMRGYHAAMCFASPEVYYRHVLDLVELSRSDQLAARIAALRVPALFIAGGLPEGICARSRELLDAHRVRWRAIEPSGHWVYADQTERFSAAIAEFQLQFAQ